MHAYDTYPPCWVHTHTLLCITNETNVVREQMCTRAYIGFIRMISYSIYKTMHVYTVLAKGRYNSVRDAKIPAAKHNGEYNTRAGGYAHECYNSHHSIYV